MSAQDAREPPAGMRALLWKTRTRLQGHTLNQNLVRGSFGSLLGGRVHDHVGVVDAVDHAAKDRVLLVERRLLFQRDEPLAVRSVYVVGACSAERATLVRDVTEFGRHVRIRRISRAP